MSAPRRMLFALLAGGAAVVFMASSMVAAVLVGATLAIVVWDLLAQRDTPVIADPMPRKLTVDLHRRR